MKNYHDDKGNLVAVTTEAPKPIEEVNKDEVQPVRLAYLRYCPLRRFPAELCVTHEDHYFVVALNRNQLINMLELGTSLLREFDKRPIENEDLE